MELFIDFCKKENIRFISDANLSEYTSFKVGGPCAVMAFPDSDDKTVSLIRFIRTNDIKHFIIGNGTNLLALDEGFSGVIVNTSELCNYSVDGDTITCGAGVSLTRICRAALDNSLTGLEFAYGIPGTAGGAVYMNAGAYGGEMKDVLVKCEYIDENGNIATVYNEDMLLGYRRSMFTDKDNFILSLTIKLIKGDKQAIKARMDELIGKRKDKQPLEYPSAGSTFKRPEGYYAGALIEECNLKGYSVGGACVSEKHAGFVINKGGATSCDIISLIKHCKETVYKQKGVTLEPEVRIIK